MDKRDRVAQAVAECDKDFRPVFEVSDWAYARADHILQALQAAEEAAWQPISTAPRDGTPLWLFARAKNATTAAQVVGWYLDEHGWIEAAFAPNHPVGLVPTHWQPLPPRPGAAAEEADGT